MESQEDTVEQNSMFKGFSKAFNTVNKKSQEKDVLSELVNKKSRKDEENEDKESVSSVKSNRKTSVRVSPADDPEELEKKYRRIATKGVKKLFMLLNNAK